ncbi:MAG: hypothetical protein R2818_08155 [Flavobacteriales bacterium]
MNRWPVPPSVPDVTAAQPAALLWSNGSTGASITVCDTTSGWYVVTLTDDTLCMASDSVFVNVVDVHCGNNGNKVAVCHIPPGNPANAHTICISANGVPAHLAHGCLLGACEPVAADSIASDDDLQLVVSPNPMSEVASVRVRSTTAQRVRITVVDALGRRSHVLMDADMSAGEERIIPLDVQQIPVGTSVAWVEAMGRNSRRMHPVMLMR